MSQSNAEKKRTCSKHSFVRISFSEEEGEGEGVSTTIRVQNNLPFSEDSSNNSHSVPLFCIGKQDSSTRSLQAAV